MHRFRDDPQYAGFMTEEIGRTRRYTHKLEFPAFDIPCRREVRPEVYDRRSVGDLKDAADR